MDTWELVDNTVFDVESMTMADAQTNECKICGGRRYVPAPADNDWRRYFESIGQGHHHVFVGCSACNPDTRTNSAVRTGQSK